MRAAFVIWQLLSPPRLWSDAVVTHTASQDPKTGPVRVWQPELKKSKSNSVWSDPLSSQSSLTFSQSLFHPHKDQGKIRDSASQNIPPPASSRNLPLTVLCLLALPVPEKKKKKEKKSLYVVQLIQACCFPTQSSAHCTNCLPSQLLLKAQRQDGDHPGRNKSSL